MRSSELAGSAKQDGFPPALLHLSPHPPHPLGSVKCPGEKVRHEKDSNNVFMQALCFSNDLSQMTSALINKSINNTIVLLFHIMFISNSRIYFINAM